ncbi:ectoine hydroxylase-related dioxygenase (phytanoyl-CoA dioxygenase family) [Dongia mobilis]|uniref:Ectoine hydroxylase-related dioxygenase (Phytanoyl-CoA dioxygenase family) n=1 Tax=Dongia mobilis TaxID=578943 RepID=A0A4R6WJ11_9PROT|nr:phytanoyl-CoA dioxygenase family protein [Dongia mobilis]TDQ78424.1 ectoine hydroxylase-related dioxygenase (phytanoyl-CoA dioxygenase family) [Dongia mobilis]
MPDITTLEPTASVDEILAVLHRDGALIVRNLMTPQQMATLSEELRPWIDKTPNGNGDFVGYKTKRCCGVLGKSAMAGEIATHPKILELCDRVLLPQCTRYRLSVSQVISIGASETVQHMHRDDALWPFEHPVKNHRLIHCIWAVTDFSAENGATRVAPGSHLWGEGREPKEGEWTQAVMPAGSALIYWADTFHGGGANRTGIPRDGMILGYIVGWLRQEEEQFLAVPPEKAKTLPRKIQDLLGYKTHEPYLGWLDQNDCRVALIDVPEDQRGAVDLSDDDDTAGELQPGKWAVLI